MAFEIENGILKKYTEEEGITEIFIPDGVTEIGKQAFEDCQHLISVHLPDSVQYIGQHAFSGCISLKSIPIPDSLKEIGLFAFQNCDHLTSIHIPCETYVRNWAFLNCDNLTDISTDVFSSKNGEKKKIFLVPQIDWDDVPISEQMIMLRKAFSLEMDMEPGKEIKYLLLCRYLVLCPEQPKIVYYMKYHFEEFFAFAIRNNFIEAILIMINWNLLNQENIDQFIRLAIENTQKTGNPEIQLALTEYKYKHIKFTSIEDKFKL